MSTKIHFAQKANALALVLIHSDNDLNEVNQIEEFPGVHIPILMIGRSDGHKITEMLMEQRHNVVKLGLSFDQIKHDQIV